MSRNQERIHEVVGALWHALGGGRAADDFDYENAFNVFFTNVWEQLPLLSAKGSALATVSCIPIWEMLNCVSSGFTKRSLAEEARLVQMLTAMYPKSKDRRVAYQQLSRSAMGFSTSVPLSANTAASTETYALFFIEQDVPADLSCVQLKGIDADKVGRYLEKIAGAVGEVMNRVLPSCVIQCDTSAGALRAKIGDGTPFHINGLLAVLWRCLVYAEMGNLPEKKQLAQFLTSSAWARKVIERSPSNASYKSVFAPLVAACMICLSFNPRTPSTSADNIPLFDPRIVKTMLSKERDSPSIQDQLEGANAADAKRVKLPYAAANTAERIRSETIEKLITDIPGEIAFMGKSSQCRDCDRLTILCRDMLFSSLGAKHPRNGKECSTMHSALFNRKRSRDSSFVSEDPSFAPLASSIMHMLNEKSNVELNTLERLSVYWSA